MGRWDRARRVDTFLTETARYGLLDVDVHVWRLTSYLADVSAAIFSWWKFEDTDVRHDQPTTSPSQRDLDELEVRYESKLPCVQSFAPAKLAMKVHNTHIGTAKKQTRT